MTTDQNIKAKVRMKKLFFIKQVKLSTCKQHLGMYKQK